MLSELFRFQREYVKLKIICLICTPKMQPHLWMKKAWLTLMNRTTGQNHHKRIKVKSRISSSPTSLAYRSNSCLFLSPCLCQNRVASLKDQYHCELPDLIERSLTIQNSRYKSSNHQLTLIFGVILEKAQQGLAGVQNHPGTHPHMAPFELAASSCKVGSSEMSKIQTLTEAQQRATPGFHSPFRIGGGKNKKKVRI